MATRTILALIAAAQLVAWPVRAGMAERDNSPSNDSAVADTINGHHYSRGPHPLPSRSGETAKPRGGAAVDMTNGHHYSSGPHPLPARSDGASKPRRIRTGVATDMSGGHHYSSGPHPLPAQ
jgi:hypothetical protein